MTKKIIMLFLIVITLLLSSVNVNETMITEYDELLANTNYTPDLCSIMYNNLKFGNINNTERCYNIEKIINRYYPLYNQKCCLSSDKIKNNCYSCDMVKKYSN